MNTKFFAAAALLAGLGTAGAMAAANPFVDVPADSWAYQSIKELSEVGVIEGVDGHFFQGQRHITRYEAAELTARALAHMDRDSVEQRAMIQRLAEEYTDELNRLGVRIRDLENTVGNIHVSGDVRLRYRYQKDHNEGNDSWDFRPRIRFDAAIDDHTSATVRFMADSQNFTVGDKRAASQSTIYPNLVYVTHTFGKATNLLIGRWEYAMGNGLSLQHFDEMDGVQLTVQKGAITWMGGYGEFKEGAVFNPAYVTPFVNTATHSHDLTGVATGFASVDGTFGKAGAGVYYNGFSGQEAAAQNLSHIWGGYMKYAFSPTVTLLGDYQKIYKEQAVATDENAGLWGALLTYGATDMDKAGTWDAWIEYINADKNALYGSTNSWRNNDLVDNVRSWGIGVDYVIAKNVQFSAMQSIA